MTYKEIDELVNKLEICIKTLTNRSECPSCEYVQKNSQALIDRLQQTLIDERRVFTEARELLSKDYELIQKIKLDDTELRDLKLKITSLFIDYGNYSKELGRLEQKSVTIHKELFVSRHQLVDLQDFLVRIENELKFLLEKI